jgi:ribonuclease D
LLEELIERRKTIAAGENKSEIVIVATQTLQEIVRKKPTNLHVLADIEDMAELTTTKYGEQILEVVMRISRPWPAANRRPAGRSLLPSQRRSPSDGPRPKRRDRAARIAARAAILSVGLHKEGQGAPETGKINPLCLACELNLPFV